MTHQAGPIVILASASRARGSLMRGAGLEFVQIPADVDEAAIKHRMLKTGAAPEAIALELARAKALAVATHRPEAIVVGADQILECEGRCFDKPSGRAAARDHLSAFRGRRHRLISAVVAVRGTGIVWEHHDEARLTMRAFSDEFLDWYLDTAGSDILDSVGAYRLESLGAQLFEGIAGDYFTVLGLPLLPLLDYLRGEGVLAT